MTGSDPGSRPPEPPAQVSQARIDVEKAELYITPGARRAAHRLAWSLVVLFVLVLGVLGVTLVYSVNQEHVNQCQRLVNSRFQQADISRAQAQRVATQAQIRLWDALLALHGTQAQKLAEFDVAFAAYKAELTRVTAVRYPARTGLQSCS